MNKFCSIGLSEGDDRKKGSRVQGEDSQYKLMKSKEQIKILMLHIIGLVVHLSSSGSAKLSFLARILKKETKELKSYCVELGFRLEPCKSLDQETGKEYDDTQASLKGIRGKIAKKEVEEKATD